MLSGPKPTTGAQEAPIAMQTITQNLPSSQDYRASKRRLSKIELLDAARIALEAEAEADDAFDNDAFCEEHSAISSIFLLQFRLPILASEKMAFQTRKILNIADMRGSHI